MLKNNRKRCGAISEEIFVECDYEKIDQEYLKLLRKLESIIKKIKENHLTS